MWMRRPDWVVHKRAFVTLGHNSLPSVLILSNLPPTRPTLSPPYTTRGVRPASGGLRPERNGVSQIKIQAAVAHHRNPGTVAGDGSGSICLRERSPQNRDPVEAGTSVFEKSSSVDHHQAGTAADHQSHL